MRIVIDTQKCTATTTCVRIAPQLFALPDGADWATVKVEAVDSPELVALAKECELSCPTGAIELAG